LFLILFFFFLFISFISYLYKDRTTLGCKMALNLSWTQGEARVGAGEGGIHAGRHAGREGETEGLPWAAQ
jgi:hypothetical protein